MSLKRRKVSRGGLWIILIAAVVLELTACLQYFASRYGLRVSAEQRASLELRRAELEIQVQTSQLEEAVKVLAMFAEQNLDKPESMYSATRVLLETLDNVESAGIAFKDGYYPQKGKWYEVCSSRVDGEIYTREIGGEDHDYLQSEWFHNGMTIDSCWWCEPYLDDAGARAMVVSCSYPIRNKAGEVVAVALVDLSLAHLKHLSEYLQIYPESYYSISSGKGIDIVPPPDTIPGRKYAVFEEEIDATGWKIGIIIPEDVMFADLRRFGRLISILMLIGLLTLVFIMYRVAKTNEHMIASRVQEERIEGELSIAKSIQMAMLPKRFPPFSDCQDLNMYGFVRPAKEVGGDLYDFFIRENKLFFCIGDVSGKGVPASLVMAVVRSQFRTIGAHEDIPAKIVVMMNESLSEVNDMNMFITMFLGVLDLKTGELNYCNAGHNAPIVRSSSGEQYYLRDEKVAAANLPVGILSGFSFHAECTSLHAGDTLFLYTDGLTEAENTAKQLFGESRVESVISSWKNDFDAHAQIESMLQAVESYVGSAEQSDDLTMLAIRYIPQAGLCPAGSEDVKRHSIVMRNDIEQIPTLAEWVESLGVPSALNMTINLALEEAVTNVMLYAYPKDKKGSVLIEAEKRADQIKFVISDSGIAFDPTQQAEADITLSAEDRAIGGLGIHLVRQIMDDIRYERIDGKNILTLTKNI